MRAESRWIALAAAWDGTIDLTPCAWYPEARLAGRFCMKWLPLFLLAAAHASFGCGDAGSITCQSNADCLQGGIPGTCLDPPSGNKKWCAFSDASCASGSRWGVKSGDDLGGMCVDGPPTAATHVLSVVGGPGGSITSSPSGIVCGADCLEVLPAATTVVLTAHPEPRNGVVAWGGDCAAAHAASTCSLNMMQDRSVTVSFARSGSTLSLTTVGGPGTDLVDGLAVDGEGSVYVAGHFTDMLTIGTSVLIGTGGQQDIFVAKFLEDGKVSWAKSFGGAGAEQAFQVVTDSSNNVWLVGFFSDAINFGGGSIGGTGQDGFLAGLNGTDGSHLFSQKMGPVLVAVASDPIGNIYAAGEFSDPLDIGNNHLTSAGAGDIYLVKVDTSRHVQFSIALGGTGNEAPSSISTDADGNVLLAGSFDAPVNFGSGLLTNAGQSDGFVAKLSPGGACLWARGVGGAGNDSVLSVVADRDRNVYADGSFVQTADLGGGTTVSEGGSDVFAIKYAKDGTFEWSTASGGIAEDRATGIAMTSDGDPVVVGSFEATALFGSTLLTSAGAVDAFAVRLSSSTGAAQWASRMGGPSADGARFVVSSPKSRHLVVAGSFETTATFGQLGATAVGFDDVYITELMP
jgi:hypothetical protein